MNITLIGMPGAGKSTVGRALAKRLGWKFVDVDALLEEKHGKPLQQILDEAGDEGFLKLEEDALLQRADFLDHTVLSPGGSIVYCPRAMEFLNEHSKVVFLDVPLEEIKKRIAFETRGIVGGKGKTLEEIYVERRALYQKYADATLNVAGQTLEEQVARISTLISPS